MGIRKSIVRDVISMMDRRKGKWEGERQGGGGEREGGRERENVQMFHKTQNIQIIF